MPEHLSIWAHLCVREKEVETKLPEWESVCLEDLHQFALPVRFVVSQDASFCALAIMFNKNVLNHICDLTQVWKFGQLAFRGL